MPSSWLESLREADSLLTQLETLWPRLNEQVAETGRQLEQAQRQLGLLRSELARWQKSSEEWELESRSSQESLARVKTLLAELTRRYGVLSAAWSDYREEVLLQTKLRERTITVWRAVGLFGPVIAVGVGWLLGRYVPR